MTLIAGSTIASSVCAPSDLSPDQRDAMFDLLCRHFDGVAREQFERDLFEKNVVLLLHDRSSGALSGERQRPPGHHDGHLSPVRRRPVNV